jgi:hypothetical protein
VGTPLEEGDSMTELSQLDAHEQTRHPAAHDDDVHL